HEEYEKAIRWVKENCKEGFDLNAGKDLPEIIRRSKVVDPDKDWEFITKMTLVVRDILNGNTKLDGMGWHEEALGKNAVAAGFQGQRNWTDWLPTLILRNPSWRPLLTGTARRCPPRLLRKTIR